jgi:hypothetical protein
LVNDGYGSEATAGAIEVTAKTGSTTNAIGVSGVDPGRSLESIETCWSPSANSLDMLIKSCEFFVLSNSSILDIHRIMDEAV